MRISVGRLPIRTRLALIYTGLLVAALAIFGTGTFLVLRLQLRSSLDTSLMANAHHAAGAFAQDVGADGQVRPTPRLLDQFAATGGRVEILDSSGKLVLDSAPAGMATLPIPAADIAPGTHPQDVHSAIAGGESYRVVVEPISGQGQSVAGYVVWAASTRDTDELLRTVALVLVLGGILLTALAFAAGWRLARRALAPIADVTDTARAISLSGDFGARVEGAGSGGDEVSELAVAFNEMLVALEANHQALQRFLGDASHELRTPLTTLRASLDLVARPALPPEEREALVADARAETERMARLVGDLLSLARAESGARLEVAPVELDAVLLEAVRQAGPAAPHVRMEVGDIEPVVVQGDRDRLKELLLIVLDNAGRYTPKGGTVRASLRLQDNAVLVEVADTGVGIPESERPHVFDRLYRGSAARSMRPSGTGLGLAIARWIVDAHAGSIAVAPGRPSGTVVSIKLPASGR